MLSNATNIRDLTELFCYSSDLVPSLLPILDKPIGITYFSTLSGDVAIERNLSLRDLSIEIKNTTAPTKKRLPLIKLGVFGNCRSDEGSLRHDANLIEVHGIEGDYDEEQLSARQAARRLGEARVAALVYTTPSHSPDAPRWRVLCPTSEPLPPEKQNRLVARVNGVLGGTLDSSSFVRSQAFFIGYLKDDIPPTTILVEGRPIDLAHDLDGDAIGPKVREGSSGAPSEPLGLRLSQAARMLDDLTDWRDEYGSWRDVGFALHHEFEGSKAAWEIFDEWSRDGHGYDRRNNRKLWNRFDADRPGGLTMRTLNAELHRRGSEAAVAEDITDEFEDLPSKPSRNSGGLTFRSPDQCADMPSRGYVVKGLLAPGDVGCIFGAPGAGKSLIAPHLGYMVAQGGVAFGMRTKQGGVFYVAAEDEHGMCGRVSALRIAHGDASHFTLIGGASDLLTKGSTHLKSLLAAVADRKPALIIVDTLAMAFPGLEENSAEAMGRVVAVARALAKNGAAVLLIHHDTKAEGGTPRGHSLLNGALDVAMHLARGEGGIVRGRLTKNRNGTCDRDIAFAIDIRELGVDADSEPVTAALVRELTTQSLTPRRDKPSASESAALITLSEQLPRRARSDKSGQSGRCPGVSEAAWRDACVEGRKLSASDKPDSRRKAFDRAVSGLVRKGWVVFRDGFYFPADAFDEITACFDDADDADATD